MTHDLHRVHIIDHTELEKAQRMYHPFAKKGFTVNDVMDQEEIADAKSEISEVNHLLYVTVPHYIRSKLIIKLEKLSFFFEKEWRDKINQLKSAHEEKKHQKLCQAEKSRLKQILRLLISPNNDNNAILDDIINGLEDVQNPDQLTGFFASVIEKIDHDERFNLIYHKTPAEFARGVQIDKPNVAPEAVTEVSAVENFKRELRQKGADEELVNFVCEYLNQEYLIRGANYFVHPFKLTLIDHVAQSGEVPSSFPSMRTVVQVESDNSVLITYEQNFYDQCGEGALGKTDARAFLQYRINRAPIEQASRHGNISIDVIDGYLDIYHPALRETYIKKRVTDAVQKIKKNKQLTANDKLAIDLYLKNFRLPSNQIDPAKLQNSDDDASFLLMWNDCATAADLLSRKNFLLNSFFSREPAVITADLNLIESTHLYSPQVGRDISQFIRFITLIENKNVKAIQTELSGDNKNELLICLLSIKNVPFIKKLIDQPTIKNNLSAEVLTHFALQGESVAKSLLQPTRLERFKFWWKSAIHSLGPGEQMPHRQFNSPQLKRIVQAYPNFWNTLFAKPKNTFLNFFGFKPDYRSRLEGKEIMELIDVNQPRSDSWYKAVDNVVSNGGHDLFERALPQLERPLTLQDQMPYINENRRLRLGHLVATNKLREIHTRLSDQELFRFYKSKFEHEYQALSTNLILAIEDLWGDRLESINNPWANAIPRERKHIVIAALMAVVNDKKFDVAASGLIANGKLPEDISIAEVFLTEPFQNAFHDGYFTPTQMHNLQSALLKNRATFTSLFHVPEMNSVAINSLSARLVDVITSSNIQLKNQLPSKNKTLINVLFKNKTFISLVQSSPLLYKALKQAFDHSSIQELAKTDFSLASLQGDLFKKQGTVLPEGENYALTKELFEDETFIHSLSSFPSLHEYFMHMLTNARFMLTMKDERDLFLFTKTWKIVKAQCPQRLFDLMVLLPSAQFEQWLYEHSPSASVLTNTELANECSFLIEKLIHDKIFSNQFMQFQPESIKKLLLLKANSAQLNLLLLNSKEFGDIYLASLSALNYNDVASATKNHFREFLEHCNRTELGLLISKYPPLREQIHRFDLNGTVADKLENASSETYRAMSHLETTTIDDLGSTQSIELQPSLQYLLSRDSYEIGAYLLAILKNPEATGKVTEVLLLLRHPPLLYKFLKGASENRNVSLQLEEIFINFKKYSVACSGDKNYGDDDLNHVESTPGKNESLSALLNNILYRIIVEPKLWPALQNAPLKHLFNAHAEPELLAKFLVIRNGSVQDWYQALSRIANNPQLFEQSLPYLKQCENFSNWLFYQSVVDGNTIFRRSAKKQPLISEQELVKFMEAPHAYSVKDMAQLLMNQYEQQQEPGFSQPCIRGLLASSPKARQVFLKNSFNDIESIYPILMKELAVDEHSILASDMLSEPYINYLLEVASNDQILGILPLLSQEDCNLMLSRLISLYEGNNTVRAKLLTSRDIIVRCLNYSLSNDHQATRDIILLAFNQPDISHEIADSILSREYLQPFTEPGSGNQLIEYFLNLVRHEIQSNVSYILENFDIFKRMFEDDISPSLKQKLIVAIFDILRDEEGHYTALIKDHLFCLKFLQSYDERSDLLKNISADELINLYIAEESVDLTFLTENNPEGQTYIYFKQAISSGQFIDKVFLLADESKLVDLFAADSHFVHTFIEKMQEENDLGRRLRERLGDGSSPNGNQIVKCLLANSDEPAHLQSQLRLMQTSPQLCAAFMKELELSPSLLTGNTQKFDKYMRFFIQEVPGDDVVRLLQVVQSDNAVNPITQRITSLLISRMTKIPVYDAEYILAHIGEVLPTEITNDPTDEVLRDKLVKYFQNPELQVALFDSIVRDLPLKQFSELLDKYEEIEDQFVSYLNSKPEKMIEMSRKDENGFLVFYLLNRKRIDLYLLVNEKLSDSPLTERIIDEHTLDSRISEALLTATNPVLMAQVVNRELLGERTNRCDLLLVSTPPRKNMIHTLPISSNAAYIRVQGSNQLFYVNKITNECIILPNITQDILQNLDSQMNLSSCDANTPRTLTSQELEYIISITDHTRRVTPFTDIMLNQEFSLLSKLFEALPLIDARIIFSERMRDALDFPAVIKPEKDTTKEEAAAKALRKFIKNILAFEQNFTLTNQHSCIKFTANNMPPVTFEYRMAYFYCLKLKLDGSIWAKRSDTYQLYSYYIKSVELFAHLDDEGILRFKETEEAIPYEYAIYYFEALARFFYLDNDTSIQKLIERKPRLQSLMETLRFDEDGKARFNEGIKAEHVPVCYLHMVLFAYCQDIENLDNNLPLAKAFLKSILFKEGQLLFKGTKNIPVPESYRMAILRSAQVWFERSPGTLVNANDIQILGLLDENLLHHPDSLLMSNILNSVYVDTQGVMRCKDSGEKASEDYQSLVLGILEEYPIKDDPQVAYLLYILQEATGEGKNFDLLHNIYVDEEGHIRFNANNVPVPIILLEPVLRELSQKVKNKNYNGLCTPQMFALIAKLPDINEHIFDKDFRTYIIDNVRLNELTGDTIFGIAEPMTRLPLFFGDTFRKILLNNKVDIKACYNEILPLKAKFEQATQAARKTKLTFNKDSEKLHTYGVNGDYPDFVKRFSFCEPPLHKASFWSKSTATSQPGLLRDALEEKEEERRSSRISGRIEITT